MHHLIARLLGIGKYLWEFLSPILKSSAGSALTAILPIAADVVRTLAANGRPGAEKREMAVRQIQQIAIAEGISAAESVVRSAIELAVLRMKSERP